MSQKVDQRSAGITEENAAFDHGWAWVIAFAGTLANFLSIGMYRSLAILIAEFIDIYDRPTADISLIFTFSGIGQCLTALLLMFGLGDIFHERALVVAAGVLSSAGFIVTYFSRRLTDVYVLGFCVAMAICRLLSSFFGATCSFTPVLAGSTSADLTVNIVLNLQPAERAYLLINLIKGFTLNVSYTGTAMKTVEALALSMAGRYFRKRLALASAIVQSGVGLGVVILPPVFQWLIDEFTYRGAALIMAAVCLNTAVSGALMRPKQTFIKAKRRSKNAKDQIETAFSGPLNSACSSMQEMAKGMANQAFSEDDVAAKSTKDAVNRNINKTEKTVDGIQQSPKTKCKIFSKSVKQFAVRPRTSRKSHESILKSVMFSIKFFENPTFILIQLFIYFATIGCEALLSFYPAFTRELGMTSYQSAFLLSIVGGVDICGRLFYGFLADCKFMESYKLLLIPITILGCTAFLSRFATELWSQVLYAVVIGLNYGTLYSLRSVVLVDLFGQATLLRRLGVINLISGLGYATSGVLIGSIRDRSADYTLPFQVTGSIFFASGLSLMAIAFESYCRQKRNSYSCNQ